MTRCLFAAALLATALGAAPLHAGDALRGKDVYESYCGACHSIDADRVGPAHRGVFGRKPGKAPGYAYSPALKAARFTWNDQTLDQWLQGPAKLVPGSKMGFSLSDPQKRADVIAYLKSQGAAKPK